jgi:hypothetical protein
MMKRFAFVIIAALLCAGLAACGSSSSSKTESSSNADSAVKSAEQENAETVLADTDDMRIVLKSIEETAGIQGATLYLEWENKTDYDVTVYPENGTANGYSITIMSGIPTDMKAHGKSKNPLILSYAQFDAQSVDDVQSFSFDAVMRDGDFNEVARAAVKYAKD